MRALCLLSLLLQNCDHHPAHHSQLSDPFPGSGLERGPSRLSVSSSLFLVATADPGSLLRGIDHRVHGPGLAFSPGKFVHGPWHCPILWPEKEGHTFFFGDKSWPREEAAVPVPRSPSSLPAPVVPAVPSAVASRGTPPPGFLSKPRLVSRGQWRPQVPQDNWAQH